MTLPYDIEVEHEYSVIEVDGSSQALTNAQLWCKQTFGTSGNRWFFMSKKFYFKHEKDAMWFELRW